MRSGNLFSRNNTAVLDAPEQEYAFADSRSADSRISECRPDGGSQLSTEFIPEGRKRGAMVTEMPLRQGAAYASGYADADEFGLDSDVDPEYAGRARRSGLRVSFHGALLPKSLWGRILSACMFLMLAGAGIAAAFAARKFLLHDEHFLITSADAIQIDGNSRLSRAQLLSVFGEDVDRNIFNIPLTQRRAELESLPWVEHATVMRILPNRVRVSIVERRPVAFVRQGSEIGLVDASGVLLNLPGPDLSGTDLDESSTQQAQADHARDIANYSFPVLTGISASDPLSTRAARMKIYLNFIATLDATGENISRQLSEVDVTSPEDVKAIIPDAAAGGADVLVHFGDGRFLERYRLYEQHLAEWRAQYPKLSSADMRYERQVVLEMMPSSIEAAHNDASLENSLSVPAAKPNPELAAAAAKGKVSIAAKKQPIAALLTGRPASVAHVEPVAHATRPYAYTLATGKVASHWSAAQAAASQTKQGAMR
jgi:cell division protein FtsQ